MNGSPWRRSWRADPVVAQMADRHYSRKTAGAPQFVPPGRCLVLKTADGSAAWVTAWPLAEYAHNRWAGTWINQLFRNEGCRGYLSSELIAWAVAHTRAEWPDVPELGIVTFVGAAKIRSTNPGYCYQMAGWQRAGFTKDEHLHVFQQQPAEMPAPQWIPGSQRELWETAS